MVFQACEVSNCSADPLEIFGLSFSIWRAAESKQSIFGRDDIAGHEIILENLPGSSFSSLILCRWRRYEALAIPAHHINLLLCFARLLQPYAA